MLAKTVMWCALVSSLCLSGVIKNFETVVDSIVEKSRVFGLLCENL